MKGGDLKAKSRLHPSLNRRSITRLGKKPLRWMSFGIFAIFCAAVFWPNETNSGVSIARVRPATITQGGGRLSFSQKIAKITKTNRRAVMWRQGMDFGPHKLHL